MNVKPINQFIQDIDQKQLKNWKIQKGCHPKIKDLTLTIKHILQEKTTEQTVHLTHEKNPKAHPSYTTYRRTPRKYWQLKKQDLPVKPEPETLLKIAKQITDPVAYDNHLYWSDDEVTML